MTLKNKRIYIAGHNGMVGSALIRQLKSDSSNIIITASKEELDLTNQQSVSQFFANNKIDQVYLAAAKVGGIHANNTYPADFIYQNLMIEANIINAAHMHNVQKLLFLGSSCIYPKLAEQPMSEAALLTGILESTNEPYGQNDNFHPENSHVIPALIRRFHEAKINNDPTVTAWGSGKPMREFLYVDDMAEASIFVMNLDLDIYEKETQPMLSHINVGLGIDCTIRELVETVAKVVGYEGDIVFDTTKPDGTARKLMDVSRLERLGWKAKTNLESGLKKTYEWFLANKDKLRF
jgi:GDP-L-fucose synthase